MKKSEKIFSEIRFNGQLSIIEDIGKVVRFYYPKYFPHWRIENNTTIKIYNNENLSLATEVILIDHSKFVYSTEYQPTSNYFQDKLLSYYKLIDRILETNQVVRIGVRSITLIEQESKQFTIDRYNSINNSDFVSDFESKPTDYYHIYTFENQRITFGPLAKNEANQYQTEFNDKSNYTENMFLYDIDNFRQTTLRKDVPKTIEKVISENRKTAEIIEKRFRY